ncbi:MAG: hypothetical protein HY809_02425 [Nitrospirae bacterium]|nr:hypothetical protein [Nitrospirota bacterium]
MYILLPVIAFAFLFLLLRRGDASLRESFLSASVIWALILTAITEGLSVFSLLTLGWVASAWAAAVILLAVFLFFTRGGAFGFSIPSVPKPAWIFYYTAFILILIGLTALMAPPNEWDSMAYHMSRVMHWIQNQSVANYPTNILRQLTHAPWSEFVFLHLQMLSGGDRFANLVQWSCMIGSLLGVSLIAKLFGADERGQAFASLTAATIPMGILQASTTQNDYAVAFWLVAFLYYLLLIMRGDERFFIIFMSASSLGLAIFTKGTAYIYAFPFLSWFFLWGMINLRRNFLKHIFIFAAVILFINIGHYKRNYDISGSPILPAVEARHNYAEGNYKVTNDIFTLRALASNLLRGLSLHIGTPVRRFNLAVEKGVGRMHELMGTDVNDPRTTYPNNEFHIPRLSTFEADAGNPLHIMLIFIVIFYAVRRGLPGRGNVKGYFIVLIISFMFFTFLIKWQPWLSRLHLPLFVLWSPLIAVVLADFHGKKTAAFVTAALALSALLWVFFNSSRPLIFSVDKDEADRNGKTVLSSRNIWNAERSDQFFLFNIPEHRALYLAVTDILKTRGCSDVGLALTGNNLEYPFWVLLQKENNSKVRIKHVDIVNVSSAIPEKHPFDDFIPCAVISTVHEGKEKLTAGGIEYIRNKSIHSGNLFLDLFVRK